MALTLGLLVVGAVALYAGASVAVRAATTLARAAGISAFFLGAVVFGIDLDVLAAAVTAAGRGRTEIAGGVAFGSVLFLLTAGFGVALLVSRRPIRSPSPTMLAAPALGVAAAAVAIADRVVNRLEGVLLVALYAGYVFLVREFHPSHDGGEEHDPASEAPAGEGGVEEVVAEGAAAEPGRPPRVRAALVLVAGRAILYLGAALLVTGGVRLAGQTRLLAGFIGAAVIGALCTLDEVLLEVLPVRRGVPDVAVANFFGAIGASTTGVLGVAAVTRPLSLDAGVSISLLAAAFVYAVVASTLFLRGKAGRGLGVVVLACYAVWLLAGVSI